MIINTTPTTGGGILENEDYVRQSIDIIEKGNIKFNNITSLPLAQNNNCIKLQSNKVLFIIENKTISFSNHDYKIDNNVYTFSNLILELEKQGLI